MKFWRDGVVAALAGLLMLVSTGEGQVRIGVVPDYRTVMVREPIVARVIVNNDASTPLVFNKKYNNAELQVSVGKAHARADEVYTGLDREFVLMPGDSMTNLVELSSLGDMFSAGSYQVKARILYDDRFYTSQPQAFDVVNGIEMASIKRPLSGYSKTQLTYSLRYCARNGSEYAFLVVGDKLADLSYGTLLLGPLVRVGPPAMTFDSNGRLVVVHQSGRNRFTRSVIYSARNGISLEKQTHHLPSGELYPE